MADDVIAVFKADIEQFKAQMAELGVKVGDVQKKVEDTNKKTKKGFEESGKAAKNLGRDVADNLGNKFQQLGNRIIAAFAVERVIAFGRAALNSFREAEKSANQLNFAVRNIGNEGAATFAKLTKQAAEFQKLSIFSDEQIQNAQTALIQFGLTGDQVEDLIPKILDLASAQGIDLNQATDKVIQGLNGQTRGLRDAGIAFEDTGSKTENLAILSEKLAKFQGSTAVALNTSAGAAQNLENQIDDLQEGIGEKLSPIIGELSLELFDLIAAFVGAETSADKFVKRFVSSEGRIASFTKSYEKLTDAQLAAQEKFVKLDILAEGKKREEATTDTQRSEANKRILIIGDELKAINNLQAARKKSSDVIRDDLTIKGQNEAQQAAIEAKKKSDAEQKQALDDLREFQKERNEINVQAAEDRLEFIRKEAEVAREEMEKQAEEDLILLRKQAEQAREELEEKERKRDEDRIESAKIVSETIFKAYEESFNRRQDLLDKEIESQKEAVEQQRANAQRGAENTLAFEEAELAKRRRQQQQEVERQKKIKLLETFLNSLAEFSKEDPKSALSKALLQVALATAASAVFAEEGGIIGEIGDRSNGGRRHKGGGDVLLHAQTGEGIFSRKEMDNLGRRNFHLLKDAARFPIRDDVFAMPKLLAINGGSSLNNADLLKEVKGLRNDIKNQKRDSFDINKWGEYTRTTIENGVTEVTKGKLKKPRFRG